MRVPGIQLRLAGWQQESLPAKASHWPRTIISRSSSLLLFLPITVSCSLASPQLLYVSEDALNSWSSCIYLQTAGIANIYHHTCLGCWGSKPGSCSCKISTELQLPCLSFWDSFSSTGWPRIYYVAQAGLELSSSLDSVSRSVELKVWATTPRLVGKLVSREGKVLLYPHPHMVPQLGSVKRLTLTAVPSLESVLFWLYPKYRFIKNIFMSLYTCAFFFTVCFS